MVSGELVTSRLAVVRPRAVLALGCLSRTASSSGAAAGSSSGRQQRHPRDLLERDRGLDAPPGIARPSRTARVRARARMAASSGPCSRTASISAVPVAPS